MRYPLLLLVVILICFACDHKTESSDRPPMVNNNPSKASSQTLKAENEFVIFVYHRFADPRHLSTNISLNIFDNQLNYLKENGFHILTLGEALKTKAKDEKIAVITIDDAYRSFLEHGLPVLNKYNVPATLFVNTETVGGEDYLTWDELDSIKNAGIEIGNHSHSHAYFLDADTSVYLKYFKRDVQKAQDLFKENLNETPDLFAYPFGEFDGKMETVIKEMGFRAAVAQNSGIRYKGGDDYAIPRFPMNITYGSMESFKDKAEARAFHVIKSLPENNIITEGQKPVWKLLLKENISRGKVQCFVQGGFGKIDATGDTLLISSEDPLIQRRTLYTITMPDENGNWYWISHLWINPKVKSISN